MRIFVALFICLMTLGCFQPMWMEVTTTTPTPSPRNGMTMPPEEVEDGTDHYRVTFDNALLRPWRVVFYVSSTESYRLGCHWQADNCLGLLPEEARSTSIVLIGLPRRLCSRVRIFRDDEELGVTERFRWGCGFVLGEPP